jgi:hypothetical protein
MAAGGALVSAMATDGWQQARDAVLAWCRRRGAGQPEEEDDQADAELASLRAQIVVARRDGDRDLERALAGNWRLWFHSLVDAEPESAVELRRLLADHLMPLLEPDEQARAGSITMRAEARDNARVFMSGRDQYVSESSPTHES